ncbi:MAG: xanthine dehydrogenase family protein molybdopterin-binding subunit, partial [Longimicrobiaceae bacterium]
AALVEVEYETLPAVSTIEAAVADGAPLVWDEAPGNVCFDWEIGDREATDEAFRTAAHTVSLELVNQRIVPSAIEPRAVNADYNPGTGEYTLYKNSQNPHVDRLILCAYVFAMPEHKMRVVAPDIGGGFGSKIPQYPEDVICLWAAARVERPVKWTSDRSEAFLTDAHGRDHVTKVELALDAEGRFLALRSRTRANLGAYLSLFGTATPTYLHGPVFAGAYTTPAIWVNVKGIFTHTNVVDAERGAGRPEATYQIERIVDAAAWELGMDPVEIRRKNFIRDFPYQTPVALNYDSGDYDATLDIALAESEWDTFEERRAEAAARGKLRGIGISTFTEACGVAPSRIAGALGARAGLYEAGQVRLHPTGSATVFTGSNSHGQGHETTFAQIVSDYLGIPFDQVEIVHGDTGQIPFGMGTYGSRSLAVGGSAIVKAMDKVIAKGKKIAAHLLEAAEADLEFADGSFTVAGTDRSKTIAEVAFAAYVPHDYPIEEVEPGLDEIAFYDPTNWTFPAGCHIVEVEIDPETGKVELARVTTADDVGRVINPMIVAGQLHGGLAHGLGQALLEHARFDEDGTPLGDSYMTYALPRAADLPRFDTHEHNTPTEVNPLGAKGVGEVGAIGVPPAVVNAVVDALRQHGVRHLDMPLTSEKVWRAIHQPRA